MKLKSYFIYFLSFVFILTFWQALIILNQYPSFILPSPLIVAKRLLEVIKSGLWFYHFKITLFEVVCGLILGSTLAFILGYLLAKIGIFNKLISPIFIGFQALPILALAPLLVIWFGPGISTKIIVCSLTLFFPVLINTIFGFQYIDVHYQDLFTSMGANAWQKLKYLEIPESLPILFSGLKIGAGLSVIGAVVGEFVGADRGLGFLINLAGGFYDTPLRFVAFVSLSFMALSLYKLIEFLETKIIKWRVK